MDQPQLWQVQVERTCAYGSADKKTLYRYRGRRRKFVKIESWLIMISAGLLVLSIFVRLKKFHSAHAVDPDFVTYRLVRCDVIGEERVCIYRGPNFKRGVLHLRRG